MSTDFWVRNPSGCIREVIAAGENQIVFDGGYIGARKIDPFRFLNLNFGVNPYEVIIIREHGAMHFRSDDLENPIGVYPVWNAEKDSITWLEEWCANPPGENMMLCNDLTVDRESRPVFGQENRIIVMSLPDMTRLFGKQSLSMIRQINDDYPEVQIMIHGTYTVMPLVNLNFWAFTFEPRDAAMHKQVYLPNGRRVKTDETIARHSKWIELLGFSLSDMKDPKRRCEYNVRSARWACLHGRTPTAFVEKRSNESSRPDPTIPDRTAAPRAGGKMVVRTRGLGGDKIDCDTCSLADSCKSYREGSVCTLPESEMTGLAAMFNTTDSATILAGMARLTALSARRVETAMAFEDDFGLDPEVTKLVKQTFDMAERYAKLNDPMLRASVNFNNNRDTPAGIGSPTPVLELTPQQAAAMAIEHFEKQGIPRAQITREMMSAFISSQANPGEIESGDVQDAVVVE